MKNQNPHLDIKMRMFVVGVRIEKDATGKIIRKTRTHGCWGCKQKFTDKKLAEAHKCSSTSLESAVPAKLQPFEGN